MTLGRCVVLVGLIVIAVGLVAWFPVFDIDGDGISIVRESQLGTNPLVADSDNDTVADDRELALGTNPLDPDSDGDDLTDGEELDLALDPTTRDTDADGLGDGAELRTFGSDPHNASPAMRIEPHSLHFVGTDDGQTNRTVVVRNPEAADGPLRVRAATIVGRDAGAYTIVQGDGPFSLNPGESRQLVVRYDDPGDGGDHFATLRLLSNDPDRPQADVWLADNPTTVEFETRTAGNRTRVTVDVRDAAAGSTIPFNLSRPSTRNATVGVQAVGISVAEARDLRLNVTSSRAPFSDTAAFDVGRNTTDFGYFRIEHDVPASEIESGWIRFRLAKSLFAGNNTRPENVVLYRFNNGRWQPLEGTAMVGETETHYLFRAVTPGFSDFAAGVKRPDFQVAQADVDVEAVRNDTALTVRARITNIGGADGLFNAKLLLNGEVVDTQRVSVAVDGTRQVTLVQVIVRAGTYEVLVNDFLADVIIVEQTPSPTSRVPGGLDPLLLGGLVGSLLVGLLIGLVLLSRLRRS